VKCWSPGSFPGALKGRRFRGHHFRLERERLLILHRRVRAHYVASFLCKALATPVMFLAFVAFPGLADVLEREDAPTACFYALIAAIFLPQFRLRVEVSEMEEAVEAFSDAVLAGKGSQRLPPLLPRARRS